MVNSAKAIQLKDEGNILFTRNKYSEAYEKYSAAIREDSANAVFYCNRAACSLALKKNKEAAEDAKKATELDPKYSKAWARLAKAYQELTRWSEALHAWEQAVASMPNENPTSAESEQKKIWEANIVDVKKRMKMFTPAPPVNRYLYEGSLPWDRSKRMRNELLARGAEGTSSSAWLILGSHNEYMEGVRIMDSPADLNAFIKENGTVNSAVELITNAIVREERSMVIIGENWLDRYEKRARFESQAIGAWTRDEPATVLEKARIRIEEEGWNKVRHVLAITVGTWILKAFLDAGFRASPESAIELYTNALEVLEKGSLIWTNVSPSERGFIFDLPFICGVKARRLHVFYMACCGTDRRYKGQWEKLNEMAGELYDQRRDIEPPLSQLNAQSGEDPLDFLQGHYVNPAHQAAQCKANYHLHEGSVLQGSNLIATGDARDHFLKASKFFTEAAEMFPKDDEYYSWTLCIAVDMAQRASMTQRVVLAMINKIAKNEEKMKRIWHYSNLGKNGRDWVIGIVTGYGEKWGEMVRMGLASVDDISCDYTEDGQFLSMVYAPGSPLGGRDR